jgi:hypothetical protein
MTMENPRLKDGTLSETIPHETPVKNEKPLPDTEQALLSFVEKFKAD